MPIGRPSDYNHEIADKICERIMDGESLRKICSDDDMPTRSTVFRWLSLDKAFSDQYARAKQEQAEALADEILDIVDDGRNDYMENIDGDTGAILGYKLNGENIQRSRLRLDARKWIAAKLLPKKYGDKVELEHSGSVEVTTKEQRDAAVEAALRADK